MYKSVFQATANATLNLQSSPIKFVISSSKGANNALLATISSFNFALSASFNTLLVSMPPRAEYAENSNLIASQSIDSMEFAAIGTLKYHSQTTCCIMVSQTLKQTQISTIPLYILEHISCDIR